MSLGDRFITIEEVCAATTLAPSTIYKHMALGRFPRSVRIGGRSGWSEREIAAWMQAKLDERPVQSPRE